MAKPLAAMAAAATKTVSNKKKPEEQAPKLGLAIRQAGAGGITKNEFKAISKATGASAAQVVRRIDQANQNLKAKEQPRIALNSGAANMLIRQNEKKPAAAFAGMYGGKPQYGTGQIGKTLQSMMGTPGTPGAMIKGQRVGGTPARPGFNPGGDPNKNRMIAGTQIRGGGRIGIQGFGKNQYQAPAIAAEAEPVDQAPVSQQPVEMPQTPMEQLPEEQVPSGPGMMSGGGAGAAGASKLGRAKSRLRQLGIYGRGTGLLGRGLQYGNALNA